MVDKGLTNTPYILLSVLIPAIASNPGSCSVGVEEGETGRNLSRNSLTGIGPIKFFLISASILLRAWVSGTTIAAYLAELFCVFFTGVVEGQVEYVTMIESEPTARVRNTYLLWLRFLFYRVGSWVAE